MMKNASYFILKALSVLKIFKFLPNFFGCEGKKLDEKVRVNLKICDSATWLTKNYNTHIGQYVKKYMQSDNEIWPVNRI